MLGKKPYCCRGILSQCGSSDVGSMRIIAAVMVVIGAYLGLRLGLEWRTFLESAPPSLCGCEFDNAIRHRGVLTYAIAWGVAVLAASGGVSVICRIPRGLLILAACFAVALLIPWMNNIAALPYPGDSSVRADDLQTFTWTGVCVALGLTCLFSFQRSLNAKRRLTLGSQDRGSRKS